MLRTEGRLLHSAAHQEKRIPLVHPRLVDEVVVVLHDEAVDVVGGGH